jgi:hypothetical protein
MSFQIDVTRSDRTASHGAWAIAIRVGETALTRLLRPNDERPDDYIVAPPAQLAFWLVDNWWRIRWECIPSNGMTPDWRIAHELASIGGGYAWPRLAVWSEGGRIGVISRSDPAGVVGPVRYLCDALTFVHGWEFERECDKFIRNAADEYVERKDDKAALRKLTAALQAERVDPDISAWRRLEARLGYDPDAAPDHTMDLLSGLAERYGQAAIDEAATAMPGAASGQTLQGEIEAASESRIECDFGAAIAATRAPLFGGLSDVQHPFAVLAERKIFDLIQGVGTFSEPPGGFSRLTPWKLAEVRAASLRVALGVERGPLRNKALSEILGTSDASFRISAAPRDLARPYSLRLAVNDNVRNRIVVRSRWPHDRRFEMARALGDVVWAENEMLGPIAGSKTSRQKFQRAFAQSLLCPYADLIAYVGSDQPTEEDIAAAARHFHVSERLVRTVLVNKHVLPRGRLEPSLYQDASEERLDELIEAS